MRSLAVSTSSGVSQASIILCRQKALPLTHHLAALPARLTRLHPAPAGEARVRWLDGSLPIGDRRPRSTNRADGQISRPGSLNALPAPLSVHSPIGVPRLPCANS